MTWVAQVEQVAQVASTQGLAGGGRSVGWTWRPEASYREFHRRKYEIEDPWNYGTSLFEKVRHAAMAEFALACQPHTVLDLGCGEGHFLERLLHQAPDLHATGVDVEPAAAERCRARLAGHHAEILCLDLFDFLSAAERERRGRYDVVVCGDVLYYLPPKEVARLVVPGIASLLSAAGGSLVISYADVNDHAWSVEVFRSAFRVEKEVYIKPVQEPPPWPWLVALLSLGG